MGREYYMRTIVAGRYRKVVRYNRVLPGDSMPVRNAKKTFTSRSQQYINIKNSTEKLQWLLCANYDRKDACFCAFTFRDEHLPDCRQSVKKMASDCLQKLRKEWKRQGRDQKTIYTVEGDSPGFAPSAPQADNIWETMPWKDRARWPTMDMMEEDEPTEPPIRLHWHCFMLLNREDYDVVRAFWPYGQVYINAMKVNDITTFPRLASYVTKEARNGKRPKGERSYIPSLNLEQPIIDGKWCEDYEGISVPKEAETIRCGSERDEMYGASMEFAFYRMPRQKQLPEPYKGKGLLDKKQKRGKSK